MFRRVLLFVIVNLLIVLTFSLAIGILSSFFGIDLARSFDGYQGLFIFCAIFGFGGAFMSLLLSRWTAKMFMRVKLIDPGNPQSPAERELYHMVSRLAQKAGLPKTPEVGIYQSPEVNAFATGPSRSRALVAVSAGLLNQMDSAAVEGVIGHEISHVANGDMVTMTLLQGVVNTFVMFFARIAAWALTNAMRGDRNERVSPFLYYGCIMLFEVVFGLLGMIIVNSFSRWREFRADAGSAKIAGRDKMIHGLRSLKNSFQVGQESNQAIATLKIAGKPKKRGIAYFLFATHPDIDERIARLQGIVG